MTHKSIEIPEEIYNKLLLLKKEDESLTDFIKRLIEKQEKVAPIEDFAGVFKDDSKEWEEIESLIYEQRLKNKSNRSIRFEE